jgi:hypothetical protein
MTGGRRTAPAARGGHHEPSITPAIVPRPAAGFCRAGRTIVPGGQMWPAHGSRGPHDSPEQPGHSRGEPGRLLVGAPDLPGALRALYLVHRDAGGSATEH